MKELFLTDKPMLFRHISTGKVFETTNMFYLAFDTIYELLASEPPTKTQETEK